MAKTTYKVGDKVRILDAEKIRSPFMTLKDGDIFEITGNYGPLNMYQSKRVSDGKYLGINPGEHYYIEKVEESDAKMTQLKVGDKVRIISTDAALCGFSIGDKDEITKSKHDGSKTSGRHTFEVDGRGFCDAEHIELVSPKPTKNQRITTLEQKVEAMQAEIDTLKATQKTPVTTIADAIKRYSEHTPNEQRKAIIDEAKAFVEATLAEVDEQMGWQTTKIRTYKEYGRLRIEFIVNAEERTVVALARLGNIPNLEDVLGKGIAKCAPGDVFNADIGKAIALGRALGLDVSKFEKAVQPSEVVTGMHVDTYYIGSDEKNETCPTFVTHVLNGMPAFDNGTHSSVFKITDDTEAQY